MKFIRRMFRDDDDVERRERDMAQAERTLEAAERVQRIATVTLIEAQHRRMLALPRGDGWKPPIDED